MLGSWVLNERIFDVVAIAFRTQDSGSIEEMDYFYLHFPDVRLKKTVPTLWSLSEGAVIVDMVN